MSGSNKLFFDTNAIVALLKGHSELEQIIENASWIGSSVICQLEFLSFKGLSNHDINLFEKFISRIEVVGLNTDDKKLISSVLNIRKQTGLKLPDAIIAASAIINNAALVTSDKDFDKVQGLTVSHLISNK